jgi:tetratricopeptide (TPR) repeat protein
LKELDAAEKIVGLNPRVEQQRGLTLLAMNRLKEAEESFRSALASAPKQLGALLGLAEAQFLAGEPRVAELTVRQALDVEPSSAIARYRLGRYVAAQGRVKEAVEELMKALSLNPNPETAAAIRALLKELGAEPKGRVPGPGE